MNAVIAQARDKNPDATKTVVDALRPRLSRMAVYYAHRTGEDHDDLLQEAWIGLLEALPNLDLSIGSPEQHLILRARWRLLDAVKRARVRRCYALDDMEATMTDTTELSHSEAILSTASVAEFARQLKPTQRDVLKCLLSGLTWREAGDALGCTSANIAYHVRQIQKHYELWIQ